MKKLGKEKLARLSRECLSNNINRTARIINRIYDENTRPYGYRVTQIQTLYRIAYWEPVSINTLAEKADMDRTTVIRNCRILEKDGLISIKTGKDKRYRCIELTDTGWETVNKSYGIWKKQQDEIAAIIGEDALTDLVRMLRDAGKQLRE